MNRSEVFLFVFSFYRGEISWIQFLSNDSFWMERENNLSYSSLSNILQHLSIHVSKSTKLQNNMFVYPNTMLTYNDQIYTTNNKSFSIIISDDYFRQYYMFVECMKVHNILFQLLNQRVQNWMWYGMKFHWSSLKAFFTFKVFIIYQTTLLYLKGNLHEWDYKFLTSIV